jgi:hypothetical protein
MLKTLMFLALLSGCCGTYEKMNNSYTLHHANRMGLGVALLTTACDWGTTSWAMHQGGYDEQNALMGSRPSQGTIALYMAGTMAATIVAWHYLPESLRPLVWAPVTAVEVDAVGGNYKQDVPVCGI